MAVNTQGYAQLIMSTAKDLPKTETGPIRLFFADGSMTYFQITTLANRKNVKPRDIVTQAVKELFWREVLTNEPVDKGG